MKRGGFFYESNLGLLAELQVEMISVEEIQIFSRINTNHGLIRNISFKTTPSD